MWSDQPHESHGARVHDCNGGQYRTRCEDGGAPPLNVKTDAVCSHLASRQYIEGAGDTEGERQRNERGEQAGPGAGGPFQVTRKPEHHSANPRGIGYRQENHHQCSTRAGEHRAREQQAGGASTPRKQIDHCDCHQRTCCGSGLHRDYGRTQDCRQERADGCPAGNSEHEGVRQRIAEQRLQEDARERKKTADAKSREQTRQPYFHHHRACCLIRTAKESPQRIADSNSRASRDERRNGNRGSENEKHA